MLRLWILLQLYTLASMRPASQSDIANPLSVPPPEIMRFMRRFGYLEDSAGDSEALYHESAIVDAIRNVQRYAALPQTGQLDNETLELFSKPRCGVADLRIGTEASRRKRFVIGGRAWNKRKLRFFIANWSNKLSKAYVEYEIERALNLWSRYSGLYFERVFDSTADIIVGFGTYHHGDNFPFDGPGNILAHAYYPYEMGAWGGDVHFDEDEDWVEKPLNAHSGVDFYSVALHELGHSLGLAHSPIPASIMFPYYKGPDQSALDYDDTLAMYELYDGEETEQQGPSIDTTTPTVTSKWEPTFEGDYETVTDHKNRHFPTPLPNEHAQGPLSTMFPQEEDVPDICQGHFDATVLWNGSVHIFKKSHIWKINEQYAIDAGYPKRLKQIFPILSGLSASIDAAYQRFDGILILFIGTNYWAINGTTPLPQHPRSISDYIGPNSAVSRIDAAMVWPKNNMTYLFAGSKFWRYNDATRSLDAGYPKSMRRWRGIPTRLDAIVTLANGKTYFFKENLYWLYNNLQLRPANTYPRRASTAWLGCPQAANGITTTTAHSLTYINVFGT